MADAILLQGAGGGTGSDECTAGKAQVLEGYTAVTSDSDDEAAAGTMKNNGAQTATLKAGGSYTIPEGYHNGGGSVKAEALSSQTSGTATAANILTGKTAWVNGSKVTGSMANNGDQSATLAAGGSKTIPAGYTSGGTVSAQSLSSQTSGTATAANILSGKTAWVNGSKITGTLSVTSAISFSAAALSYNAIRISWKNPAKGPWEGIFIQMSTSGYPGSSGGTRVYTGKGNSTAANGSNYVDITGLSANTQYYFTCTSYCNAIGWAGATNVAARTANSLESLINAYVHLDGGTMSYWNGSGMLCYRPSDVSSRNTTRYLKNALLSGNTITGNGSDLAGSPAMGSNKREIWIGSGRSDTTDTQDAPDSVLTELNNSFAHIHLSGTLVANYTQTRDFAITWTKKQIYLPQGYFFVASFTEDYNASYMDFSCYFY